MEKYNNLELKVDENKLHLSYHRDVDSNNVVVLPISYNECWTLDKDYKIVKTYGGMLGIEIPKGSNDISINLTFKPRYLNEGALISISGLIIYAFILIYNYRRLKLDEENNNYCTLL